MQVVPCYQPRYLPQCHGDAMTFLAASTPGGDASGHSGNLSHPILYIMNDTVLEKM